MEARRFQIIKELVEKAEALPVDQRHSFLEKACGEDHSLLQTVFSMLAWDAEKLTFLEKPLLHLKDEPTPSLQPGSRVDEFEILQLLGSGGMGSVYLAQETKGGMTRQVALKVLKRGMDTQELVAQFQNERRILANLNHPNLVRLLSVGTTQEGLPYFTMDYVAGKPLLEYCDHHHLTIHQRLALFKSICETVHYAHQNLVIHRDIKPGNILVTEAGTPKLLDFGIAKVLDPSHAVTPGKTLPGYRAMTPQYASPEQFLGNATTTASDIFSLGVVLYELLSGFRPFQNQHSSGSSLDLARATIDTKPPKLDAAVRSKTSSDPQIIAAISRARQTDPQKMCKQLAGDLNHLVQVALRKDPERRYSSVAQFASEMERYLKGLPLLVDKESFFYVLKKFLARHKLRVAAVTSAIVVLVALVGLLGIQRQQTFLAKTEALQASQRAQQEAQQLEEFVEFLVYTFRKVGSEADKNEQWSAKELIGSSEAAVRKNYRKETDTRFRLLTAVADAANRLGHFEYAAGILDEIYQWRLKNRPEERAQLAHLLGTMSSASFQAGKLELAEKQIRQTLEIYREDPKINELTIGEKLVELARVDFKRGKLDQAAAHFLQGIELLEKHPNAGLSLAGSYESYSIFLRERNQFSESETWMNKAKDIKVDFYGEDSELLGSTWNQFGTLYSNWGKFELAENYLLKTEEVTRRAFGTKNPKYTSVLNNLAVLYIRNGNSEKSLAYLERHRAIMKELYPGKEQNFTSMLNQALAFAKSKLYEEADSHYQTLLVWLENVPDYKRKYTAVVHNNYGSLQLARGELGKAKAHFEIALEAVVESFGADSFQAAFIYTNFGKYHRLMAQYAEAKELLERAYRIRLKKYGDQHVATSQPLHEMAEVAFAEGNYQVALEKVNAALAIRKLKLRQDDPKLKESSDLLQKVQAAL